jgi:hypothetical protein
MNSVPNQVGKTKVLMTMVGGKVVYEDSSWRGEQSSASKQGSWISLGVVLPSLSAVGIN